MVSLRLLPLQLQRVAHVLTYSRSSLALESDPALQRAFVQLDCDDETQTFLEVRKRVSCSY